MLPLKGAKYLTVSLFVGGGLVACQAIGGFERLSGRTAKASRNTGGSTDSGIRDSSSGAGGTLDAGMSDGPETGTSGATGSGGSGGTAGTGGSRVTGGAAGAGGFATGGAPGTGGFVFGTGGFSSTGGAEAGVDAGPQCDGTLTACPTNLPGPALVPIPASCPYCMDSTEVTKAQYALFLAAVEGGVRQQDPWCDFNKTYVPAGGWPAAAGKENHPVEDVDWCDAFAYCAWAGKRLCGRVGGGSTPYADFADATKSEWHNACSAGGTRAFPYGNVYGKQACNGLDTLLGATKPVGSSAGCEGGYPGLFDLSGNVHEWEDSCNGTSGQYDTCRNRGGSWFSTGNPFNYADGGPFMELDCAQERVATYRVGSRGSGEGIRCCASAI